MSELPGSREALAGAALPEESRFDDALRPRTLDEMVGQERLRENLAIFIRAARERGESLDHLLFHGPPGLGKTSLAHVVAHEMSTALRVTSGPALERTGDLAALLSNLETGDVLFIDEIHRLPAAVEEILYPAMEDYQLDILVGQGPGARSMRLDLPRFTLVGATTRAGLLSAPLRDRFGWVARLEYYPPEDLERILLRSGSLLGVEFEDGARGEIASRSRGTPRVANRLLRRVRDFAQVEGGGGPVTHALARFALERWRSMRWVSTVSTGRCSKPCSSVSTGARPGSRRLRRRWERTKGRSKTWSSRTSSTRGSSRELPEAGWLRSALAATSGHRPVPAASSPSCSRPLRVADRAGPSRAARLPGYRLPRAPLNRAFRSRAGEPIQEDAGGELCARF